MIQALARRRQDAGMFTGALAGAIPLHHFMSSRTKVRLAGVGGFARPMPGQATSHQPPATSHQPPATID